MFLGLVLAFESQAAFQIGSFQKSVAAAGTDEKLTTINPVQSIVCVASADNTGAVYIGAEGVASSTGIVLEPEGVWGVSSPVQSGNQTNQIDPELIWIDAETNANKVSCSWVRY